MEPLVALIDQSFHVVESFTLECGSVLKSVPVAYKTWGFLNETRDNCMIICHAFTGSADVEDWWGPLIGRGKAFDPGRYFVFCANVLGSPYGTASPVTTNPTTGKPYGPEFPPTTIRDDVRLHKYVLDHLGVRSVAVAIGGSMGGMAVLEWPLCSSPGYVRHVIPLATSACHSAWCISWGEAQRQSIYSDPAYQDGYYGDKQPASGLAAARMSALLTYRSSDSFGRRFGRKHQLGSGKRLAGGGKVLVQPESSPVAQHNDGHRNAKISSYSTTGSCMGPDAEKDAQAVEVAITKPAIFSAQSYLRYQGDKFTARFDANCYIHITRKMDSHDVSRGRGPEWPRLSSRFNGLSPPNSFSESETESQALSRVLSTLPPRALIIGIESDGLFTTKEQKELAAHIPDAELVVILSPEGHDGFLLEFEAINQCVLEFLRREFPEYYRDGDDGGDVAGGSGEDFRVKKTSVFGEAEVDVTRW